jgi:hypothetical protein
MPTWPCCAPFLGLLVKGGSAERLIEMIHRARQSAA